MSLDLNHDRREFMAWLADGRRVYRSDGGKDMVIVHPGDNRRCETRLKEWTEHVPPLAVLNGRYYELTAEGQKLREEAS